MHSCFTPDGCDLLHPSDPAQPFGYNPLRQVRPEFISLAASGLMEVLKKMWADSWGVRMEHILRNVLLALLEQPDATLSDVLRLLSDRSYRKNTLEFVLGPARNARSAALHTHAVSGPAYAQDDYRERAPPENDSETAHSRSTPLDNFEIGSRHYRTL
jgi:hypothetical protein